MNTTNNYSPKQNGSAHLEVVILILYPLLVAACFFFRFMLPDDNVSITMRTIALLGLPATCVGIFVRPLLTKVPDWLPVLNVALAGFFLVLLLFSMGRL